MADLNTLEDVLSKHKKEKKELLATVQKMKHGIPKGDKKKKKDITAEIAQMTADLDLKHAEEVKNFQSEDVSLESNPDSKVTEQDTDLVKDEPCTDVGEDTNTTQKLSKAQKRRNKKSLKEKEREKAIAEQEIINLTGNRSVESAEISKKLSARGLTIHEVPSDGNCLYAAIEHQLSTLNLGRRSVESLRESTANYLLAHKEDYVPFLSDSETGGILSDDKFFKYCEDIRTTSAWGGHVEIQALTKICCKPIEIIQATGPSIIVGNENKSPKLIISYHRHAYGLGEHYNSVVSV